VREALPAAKWEVGVQVRRRGRRHKNEQDKRYKSGASPLKALEEGHVVCDVGATSQPPRERVCGGTLAAAAAAVG